MKRLLLILNPCSGKKRANRALAEIVSIFNRGGYDVTVYTTAARGDATQVAASRCREFDCVVCAGGDGTFNEVVSGVYAAGSDIKTSLALHAANTLPPYAKTDCNCTPI